MNRVAPVAVCVVYLAVSFALLLGTSSHLPADPRLYLLDGPGAVWLAPTSAAARGLRWLVPMGGALVLLLGELLFRGGRRRTGGMFVAVVALLAIVFWSAYVWNSREVLSLAWPALISVALLWLFFLDRDYRGGRAWKWELFFAALIGLATLAFIPFALGLGIPSAPRAFQHALGMVATHGVGLLLLYYAFLRRMSPASESGGILPLLGLCGRVITAVFRSGSVHGDTSMAIASVNNSLTDILRDMMAGNRRTIMYTDIRQSTETIERLGNIDAYQLFVRSWELTCAQLRDGHATTPKDVGDGLISTFDSPVEAVKTAMAILAEHARYNGGVREEERLQLKIGLHTGEVLLHHGWDPRGRDSHVAARVVAACQPDCLLMTKSTYDAVTESGLQLRGEWSRGNTLKGFSGTWDLFQSCPGVATQA